MRGIYAARYHSVAFTANGLYTWGLHGGQLGHSKDKEKTIITPKKVIFEHFIFVFKYLMKNLFLFLGIEYW